MQQGLFGTYRLEPPVRFSEHVEGKGQELFKSAAKFNYEGITSK